MQVLYLERFHCAHSNTCKLELWIMYSNDITAFKLACLSTLWFEAGVHACTLCTCIHVYTCTYSLTFPLMRDNNYDDVLIWKCLISMRSETIAYFISTVTVILHAFV